MIIAAIHAATRLAVGATDAVGILWLVGERAEAGYRRVHDSAINIESVQSQPAARWFIDK